MASRFDIQLLNNDLFFNSTGDLVIAPSDEQHIEDTINAFPGWWKENPEDGVGIAAYLGGPLNTQLLAKNIMLQLTADGYAVSSPSVTLDTSGNLIVNPNATI
jgi:hypothetical protein